MRVNYGKQLLLALVSLCCISISSAFAADYAGSQSGGASNAIAFAIQAGQIAGSAQGCGLNISTFTTRVSEAINKLALNPTDSSAATDSFQQALQQAQIAQRNNNTLPCSQVTQDFNNLPLLRPDYEQSVIAQLTPGMTSNNQTPNTATANPAAPGATTGNNPAATQPGQAGMQNNNMAAGNQPNQQQNLNNQAMPQTGAPNSNQANKSSAPSNPAYPQQNYGPMKSFSNNFSGAVKPYGMANNDNPSTGSAQQQAPTNTNNNYNNSNNAAPNNNTPPPPSFSNPNNAPPPANNAYPNQ